MDIGFEKAGFKVAVAIEEDSSCCKTLRKNRPTLKVIEGDINRISTKNILHEAGLKPLEAALVIGGPPCQSFSLAGKRLGLKDPRGKMVLEFIRVVRESLPVAFVMENVKGMKNWKNGKAIEAILNELNLPITYKKKTYRYTAQYKVLNAVNYGVPQYRERVLVIGNRIAQDFLFPTATCGDYKSDRENLFGLKPYSTVKDAIGHLPPADKPSETALRVSKTIKNRIKNHGY